MTYRYHNEARKLSEDLAEIKLAAPNLKAPELGGLDRIAQGNTALQSNRDTHAAARAGVGDAVREAEVRRNLQRLMAGKQKAAEDELAGVEAFTKAADLATADVALNQMMSGSGGPPTPERQEARAEGGKQGPAGDLLARALKEHNEGKTAASRLDKEVAKGNVSYGDAVAGANRAADPKGFSRGAAFEPGKVDDKTLGRRRALNQAKFNNEHLRADRARSQELADRALGRTRPHKPFTPQRSLQHQQQLDARVHRHNVPGMGPAFMLEGEKVHVGDNAGKFVRQVADQTLFAKSHMDVDRTLNHAALEHEKGERSVFQGSSRKHVKGKTVPVYHPHAGHLGVEPILRENHAVRGDPEAQKIFAKLRKGDSDDELVNRLSKQMGNHPDSPIPLHGKQHRALSDQLEKKRRQLQSPNIKSFQARARMEASFGNTAPPIATHTYTPYSAPKPHPKSVRPAPPGWLSQNKGKAIAALAAGGIGGAALYAHFKNKKRDSKRR